MNSKKEYDMNIMIDLPPTMEQEAREYAVAHGTTLERIFMDFLGNELKNGARRKLPCPS